jgi:hypothetical protein
VVVLSSSNSPRDIERAARFGADYAIKPPTTELFDRVANDYGIVWLRQPVVA